MNAISLLPLGKPDILLMESVRDRLGTVLGVPALIHPRRLDIEPHFDHRRGQYNSTSILSTLQQAQLQGAPVASPLLAITEQDLFIPILTYVFGEAVLKGNLAVVSYHRLQNELYGLPPDRALLIERTIKEALHELGHAFGLIHCPSLECVMHTSTYVEDIDLKGEIFCAECTRGLADLRRLR